MKFDKVSLEKKINDYAVNLFGINKEIDFSLYKEEYNKFIDILYRYYLEFSGIKNLSEYGLEFIEVAASCLKAFDNTKGEFLHLFQYSFYARIKKENGKRQIDTMRKGIKIPLNDDKLIRHMLAYAKEKQIDCCSKEFVLKASKIFNLSCFDVKRLIVENYDAVGINNQISIDKEQTVDMFESELTIASNRDKDGLTQLLEKENVKLFLDSIDSVFNNLQNRAKTNTIISKVLSIDVLRGIGSSYGISFFSQYVFFDKKILEDYFKSGVLPTNKQIADNCKVSEQSISRTYKVFKEKLIKQIKY